MINIKTFIIGQLYTNCYVISDSSTSKCIILDPGDAAYLISEYILENSLIPTAIIATHGHFDHILAVNELQLAFNIPFMIHKADKPIVEYMKGSATYWLKQNMIEEVPKIDKELIDEDTITFGESTLSIIHTPGHSPGGICLYNKKEKVIFTGDTLFHNTYGRTDLPYSSKEDMKKSLEKLKKEFKDYKAYAGHEESFIIT